MILHLVLLDYSPHPHHLVHKARTHIGKLVSTQVISLMMEI